MRERFWVLDAANETNKIVPVQLAAGMPIAAIVDDEEGGIIAYANVGSAQWIVDILNLGADDVS